MTEIFQGLSAFPVTPADAEGRVDVDALGRLLDRLVEARVHSIGLLGSTGAYAYLTFAERRRAVAAAAEAVGGRAPLIVGVGALRTDWVQALARDAEQRGADGLLLAPVAYTPPTEDEVFAHYQAAAGVTGLPICVYNNPTTTHVTLSEPMVARLSHIPGVAAVKMPLLPAGDYEQQIARLQADAALSFRIGYSGDWGASSALQAGAAAWYSVLGGLLPQTALKLYDAAHGGRAAEADALNARLEPLWALFRRHGGLRVVYALAPMLGLQVHAPPPPLRAAPAAEVEAAIAGLDDLLA